MQFDVHRHHTPIRSSEHPRVLPGFSPHTQEKVDAIQNLTKENAELQNAMQDLTKDEVDASQNWAKLKDKNQKVIQKRSRICMGETALGAQGREGVARRATGEKKIAEDKALNEKLLQD